jgi:hypothetical protein
MSVKEVMTAREREGTSKGLYLAAKGGDNDESHNHNDVGNFIVYADGEPILIDLGTENYRAQTFSSDRYALWYLQSQYHNLPTVNGIMQQQGKTYRATSTSCLLTDDLAELSLCIHEAYPKEAGIQTWHRLCTLDRTTTPAVRIRDTFQLQEASAPIQYNYVTPCEPIEVAAGVMELPYTSGKKVTLCYDAEHLHACSERIELTDPRLQRNWGPIIYRIVLTEKQPVLEGQREITLVNS